jgi:transcriptional regulator with XRE-family HTH domain
MPVPDRLKTARLRAGLTQRQLAAKLGFHTMSISQLERGVRNPSMALGWKLYLEDIARGILQPSPGAIASYARRGVGAGKTIVKPSATNLRRKEIPLVHVSNQKIVAFENCNAIIGYDVAPKKMAGLG